MSLIGWINFAILNIATIFCWFFYILSVLPATRAEKIGEKAWKQSARFRLISGILMFIITINIVLWFLFPIPEFAWIVHPNPLVGIAIGIILAVLFTPIWIKGIKDAGKETTQPSKTTELFEGIYRHIRHPQALGEMPWFVIIPLWINSLFLVLWALIMIIIVSPLIIHFEEKDLEKRFGAPYREYKKNTGALIPKLWGKKAKEEPHD